VLAVDLGGPERDKEWLMVVHVHGIADQRPSVTERNGGDWDSRMRHQQSILVVVCGRAGPSMPVTKNNGPEAGVERCLEVDLSDG
jgi:hypothetical protein